MNDIQQKLGLAAMLADLPKTKQDILDTKEYVSSLLECLDDDKSTIDHLIGKINFAETLLESIYEYRNNPDMIEVLYKKYIKENDPKKFVVDKELCDKVLAKIG